MNKTRADRRELRNDGALYIHTNKVRIERAKDDTKTISISDIKKIKLEVLHWELAVLSAVTLLFSVYFAAVENILGGLVFFAVGAWSLHRTYSQRNTVVIWIEDCPEPVAVNPEQPKDCHAALARVLRPDEKPVTET
jgi:hypothetical protein